MSTLLLRLAGPMQSWGADSRYTRRETLRYPTKSGVLGLIASAQGRRRVDPIEDLVALRFGVRVDQSGKVISDFHTAHDHRTGDSMPLSTRFYLADACFVAGIEGDRGLLDSIDRAVRHPKFPLFLGRRSCPVTGRILLGIVDSPLEESLAEVEWQASGWYRRRSGKTVYLHTYVDAPSEETRGDLVLRDEPQSFDPRRRLHSWRVVRPDVLAVANPEGRGNDIDFFAAVGGA